MASFELTRRRFVTTSASLALYGITAGSPRRVLAAEPSGLDDVTKFLATGRSDIPYAVLTEEGPAYPTLEIPWLSDLTASRGKGRRPSGQLVYLFGRILDAKGRPLPEATVELWQSDQQGRYKHPRWPGQDELDPGFGYFGKAKTGQDGTYLFKTTVPSPYRIFGITRAPHIHLKVRHPQQGVLTTQVYFEAEEDRQIREKDPIWLSIPKVTRDHLILAKQSPERFTELDIAFEPDAVCCRNDMAFLL